MEHAFNIGPDYSLLLVKWDRKKNIKQENISLLRLQMQHGKHHRMTTEDETD